MDEVARESTASKPANKGRKWIWLAIKIAVSVYGLVKVYGVVLERDGAQELLGHLGRLHWGWFAAAVGMQLTAIAFAIPRWRLLLGGQGIRAGLSFLFPSFMIGRFWGAFTPGGFGLDGWRLYDVASRTGKVARPTAVTFVEKVLGQLAFGLVVMGGSVWGLSFIGWQGVLLVNLFFLVLVGAGLTLLARPALFRWLARFLPPQIGPKLITLVDAVCAYHGKAFLLAKAVLLGAGVHAFNNLIYVCAAQALGVELSPMLVFFASSMQIMATLVPISINGVGLREAAAVALYSAVGLSESVAVLIPTVGFAAEMTVSLTGVLFLWARKAGARADLVVEDADREQKLTAEVAPVPREKWPSLGRGLRLGLGAGLLAGVIVGLAEGAVVIADGGGRIGYGVLAYGAVAYGALCALIGGAMLLASAGLGRLMQREAIPEPQAFARTTALLACGVALGLAVFRIRRDVFHESFAMKSKETLLLGLACGAVALVIYLALSIGLRLWTSRRVGQWILRSWGAPALSGVAIALAFGASLAAGDPSEAARAQARPRAPEGAPNVLVIVVDTLRADHLPGYGYARGSTPALERFAQDSVRFDQAFANASWTRPSFASILTGRYASSHGVMAKPDGLPDALTTLPEALSAGGYATAGFVTNFNVAPYFNFQQGFDEYTFLEPEFVLGADDSAAKLLLMQFVRQRIETMRAARGTVEPGTAYQDAETVNRNLNGWLDRAPSRPWFLFAAYMDPHDPYFEHPYTGQGYARAAHQSPDPSEAPVLTRLYDGEITYWDQQFGRLMDDLRRRGLYDDMMIVVTSDHGEELADHGGFWHGTTLYDEQIRVPLFVKLPGNARAGTVVRHWVQSVDLMPSILRQVGLRVPEGVQGGDLNEGTSRVFAEEDHEGNVLHALRELRDLREVKLITANAGNPRGLAQVELYRVDDDPGEQDDRAEAERAEVQSLMPLLEEARRRAGEGAVTGGEVEMNDATRRQLCQLGYIDAQQCCRDGLLSGSQCRGG